jgi:hypothetical protein
MPNSGAKMLIKMWTPQRKVQCMLWLAELKSITRVQRRARKEWNVDPPTRKSIYEWDKSLRETGSLVSHAGKHNKHHVTEVTVDRVRESFSSSPPKSIRRASRELGVPSSTFYKTLHKCLRLRAYKLQLLHHIKQADHRKRTDLAVEMLSRIEENESYVDLVLFSDESSFHACGKDNRHYCRVWGSGTPYQVTEYERDTPKLNVWLELHKHGVIGPFFFHGVYSDRTQLPRHARKLCRPTDTSWFRIPVGRCPTSLPQRCYHISG